jgi:glycosyltransferase involved in cell wall biosynthesis
LKEEGNAIVVGTTDEGIRKGDVELNVWTEKDCGRVLYQATTFHYLPLRLFLKIIPEIKKANILHITSLFYPLSWWCAGWKILFNPETQLVWSVRGELHEQAFSYSTWKKKLVFYFIKLIFRKKAVFHSTSDEESIKIFNRLGRDIRLIQLPNFLYLPSRSNGQLTKTILYLGRIHPIKGIGNLIHAFAGMENKSGFKLIIAGNSNNPYGEELRKLVQDLKLNDEVHFVGHLEGDDKEELLSKAHVLVLPSHSENFGNVVIEALAHGTPVIASQNTPWKILNEIKSGSWSPNDPTSLRVQLESIISCDASEYLEIRKRAYQLCRNEFSVDSNIAKWEHAYQSILA